MAERLPVSSPSRGRISEGPTSSLTERTLEFVASELAAWRDDADREAEESEERLNAKLCKYLTVAASYKFPMVYFFHEERQTGIRRVDVSALPLVGMTIGETYHSKYNPFLGIRRQAPSDTRDRKRERIRYRGRAKNGRNTAFQTRPSWLKTQIGRDDRLRPERNF
jgi:hypothetical protein